MMVTNMTKLSRKFLNPERLGNYINNLWSAFALADSKEDIKILFKDLFTHTEYKMFAKRMEIARRLLNGESYETIEQELSVTSNTITRVNNILAEKGNGYRWVNNKLNKLEEKILANQQERTRNLENPFRKKAQRKTVLGELVKTGLKTAKKAISRKIKHNSAKKYLPV
jgi:TrpR-related protein YerC/YecD